MKGSMSHEFESPLPADELWEVYSTLKLAELAAELLPNIISKVDVEQGNGGVGTVLRLELTPGILGFTCYKEKFIKIDHEKRLKDTIVVEGGYLTIGFSSYLVRIEILEKTADSSIIKSTIEYEVDQDHEASASFVSADSSIIKSTIEHLMMPLVYVEYKQLIGR